MSSSSSDTSSSSPSSSPPPSIGGIDPPTGTMRGGTVVTILGDGFLFGAIVGFGGTAALDITFVDESQITCTTDANATSAWVDVTVENPDHQFDTVNNGFGFEPAVDSVDPTEGPVTGDTFVTITGDEFLTGATVKFGALSATSVTLVDAQTITCITPTPLNPSTYVDVTVTNHLTSPLEPLTGTLENGFGFTPVVTGVSPDNGTADGGTSVTVSGFGFVSPPAPTVKFGGTAATGVSLLSTTSILCTTPEHEEGLVEVEVTNNHVSPPLIGVALPDAFEYTDSSSSSSTSSSSSSSSTSSSSSNSSSSSIPNSSSSSSSTSSEPDSSSSSSEGTPTSSSSSLTSSSSTETPTSSTDEDPQKKKDCECGVTPPNAKSCTRKTKNPVDYVDGEIDLTVDDLSSSGFGQGWGHTRNYTNQTIPHQDYGNGFNWQVRQWPQMLNQGSALVVVRGSSAPLWFQGEGDSFEARYGAVEQLVAGDEYFQLTAPNGTVERYSGFGTTQPGVLLSQTLPGGEAVDLTYDVNGHVALAERTYISGATTHLEQYKYDYYESGENQGRLASVTLRRRIDDQPWANIRRATYVYYESGGPDGSVGDLKLVTRQVPQYGTSWADDGHDYYRYYVDSAGGKGFIHGLKYAVGSEAFRRLTDAVGNPFVAADEQVGRYADLYFEYDDAYRVVLERVHAGTQTYSLQYEASSFADGPNNWYRKTTETRPDGTQNIVYTNRIGQMMLEELTDGENRWITYQLFDENYNVVEMAEPSAIDLAADPVYDPSAAGLDVQLRSASGLIRTFTYYDGGTDDEPANYWKSESVQEGTGGTPVPLSLRTYTSHEYQDSTVYPLASETVYQSTDAGDPATTTYTYEFLVDESSVETNQILQKITAFPEIPEEQNGSGLAAWQAMRYDEFGNMIWEQGPRGFIDHFIFDIVTGALVKKIEDVDPELWPLPGDWVRPGTLSAPLNLVTDYEFDDRGRATEEIGPLHEIDGVGVRRVRSTVFLDVAREVRTAVGWQSGGAATPAYTLVNPVSITRMDFNGRVTEQISAARASLDGRVAADDCFPQSQWTAWSRDIYDNAGLLIASRAYHTIPCCGEGSKAENYDETAYGYDIMRRVVRHTAPGGTITKATFDTRGRPTATFVGTGAPYIAEAPPTPYPANISGLEFWGSGSYGLFQDTAGTTPATAASDPVARWNDRRPGSTRAFQQSDTAKRASVAASAINGRPAVNLSQASGQQYLTLSDSMFTVDAQSPVTLFLVLRTTNSGAGYERLLTRNANSGDYSFGLQRSGSQGTDLLATFSQLAFVVGYWVFDDATSGTGAVRNVACVWKDAELFFYRDGELKDSGPITESGILGAAANSNGWSLGCELRNGGPSDWCNADVAEFLIFNRALSEAELEDLFAWAAEGAVPPATTLIEPQDDFRQITALEYDDQCGCSAPKRLIEFVNADPADNRVTEFEHDFRYRLTATIGEENYCETREYDNLNRVVRVDRHLTNPAGRLLMRNGTLFDNRGRVYQTIDYAVDSSGTVGNALVDNIWYDESRNPIKRLPAGSQAFIKTQFDSRPLLIAAYVGYYTETGDEPYAEVGIVTSDNKIFEQTATVYDAAGNPIHLSLLRRNHDATGNGPLNPPEAESQPAARPGYQANYFDGAGRPIAQADYGTNGNDAFARPPMIPERSDDVLLTSFGYDPAGNQFQIIDPASRENRQAFNALGKPIITVSNYVLTNRERVRSEAETVSTECCSVIPHSPFPIPASHSCSAGWTSSLTPGNSENVTIRMVYNADGILVCLTVCNPTTGDQVTRYEYGVTLANSSVARNDLLRATIYPDAVDGKDRVTYGYNRQSEIVQMTDQNGTIHDYEFDNRGRPLADAVALAAGSGTDDAVLRRETAYDERDLVSTITSLDAADGGNIVNQVLRSYNDFRQLAVEYQSHSGAVNTSTTPKVQYGYADGSANTIRPTTLTYPNGRVLTHSYGSSGGDNDRLSRVASIDDTGSTQRVAYTYLGVGMFVQADYSEPNVRWDLVTGSGANPYAGLDRFDRVIDCLWQSYSGAPTDLERVKYGYDRASNRLWRKNTVAPSGVADELYSYDGVQRLIDMGRGDLIEEDTVLDNVSFSQAWNLDATGNWSGLRQLDTDTPDNNLDQQRSANAVNEIAGITRRYGEAWAKPAYDRAGNMTSSPKAADLTESQAGVYDAWNRLVEVTEGESTIAEYTYDAANRRGTVTAAGGERHAYFSAAWRLLEERVDSSTEAQQQFVWGERYIDDLLLRDRSPANDGSLSERFYSLNDANWNVTAIINSAGDVDERYRYSPYGTPAFLASDFVIRSPNQSSYNWEILFAGYQFSFTAGLYNVRNRYLNAALGGWLGRDPLQYVPASNLYEYVWASPTGYSDPLGLQPANANELLEGGIYPYVSNKRSGILGGGPADADPFNYSTSRGCYGIVACLLGRPFKNAEQPLAPVDKDAVPLDRCTKSFNRAIQIAKVLENARTCCPKGELARLGNNPAAPRIIRVAFNQAKGPNGMPKNPFNEKMVTILPDGSLATDLNTNANWAEIANVNGGDYDFKIETAGGWIGGVKGSKTTSRQPNELKKIPVTLTKPNPNFPDDPGNEGKFQWDKIFYCVVCEGTR